MLGPEDLVLCAGTAPAASLRERVDAAADAGFSAISVFVPDYRRARAEGLRDADLRRLLSDRGVRVAEIDPLLRWIPGAGLAADASAEGAEFHRYGEDDFYAVAEALEARSINAVIYTDAKLERQRLIDAFGELCLRAASHGLLVHLEFLPWTQLPDLATAWAVADAVDCANGGVMLDSWQHFRANGTLEELAAAAGRIFAVQLSDAPAEPEPDPVAETLRRRRLPGDGDIDLVGLVRALDAAGCRAPIGVEVFSEELMALPAAEAARRAGDAARSVLGEARSR